MPDDYAASATDCDDADASVWPGAPETCDGLDNDCDGLVDADDGDTIGAVTVYQDADGDGFGGASDMLACGAVAGYVSTSTDCDDSEAAVNPGDGVDQDCSGADAVASDDSATPDSGEEAPVDEGKSGWGCSVAGDVSDSGARSGLALIGLAALALRRRRRS